MKKILILLIVLTSSLNAYSQSNTNPAEKIAAVWASQSASQKQSTRANAFITILSVLKNNSVDKAQNTSAAFDMIQNSPTMQATLSGVFSKFHIPLKAGTMVGIGEFDGSEH